ncbi:type 1 periplasmic binding fold superfamily protein, partial [Maribacter sp.]|nr:type 1 periplasmic binding fold superfamily protein [Maribacter sp.]
EEVITTMTVTLTGSETIRLESQDLDGDGPDAPTITVSGNLQANSTYSGSISLLNETVTPSENITEEVAEKDEEHQFFFSADGSLTTATYDDEDGNGNPVGLSFMLTTGDAGSGSLQITLRHEPKKPNDGTLADAGGETDIAQTFTVSVE